MPRFGRYAAAFVLVAAIPSLALADPGNGNAYGYDGQGNGNHYGHVAPAPILGAGVPLYLLAAAGYYGWKRRQNREQNREAPKE